MAGKTPYINDMWTVVDTLGFRPVGDQLARMIMLVEPPFCIGVNGKWGSGKTSLMRYAMAKLGGSSLDAYLIGQTEPIEELRGTRQTQWQALSKQASVFLRAEKLEQAGKLPVVQCVWFNPWQYQNEPNPLIPLLHEIRAQMSLWLRTGEEIRKEVRIAAETGLSLLGSLADSALKLAKLPHGFASVANDTRRIGEAYEADHFLALTDAQRFNLHFEKAINLILGAANGEPDNDHSRLVLFIDDLDRCEEAKAVNLLEMIKLYLSTPRCVFVLGIDRAAVESAVCRVWEHRCPEEAREYIEKLFQALVRVPTSGQYASFIKGILEDTPFSSGMGADALKEFSNTLSGVLEPNPRKVKNFLNSMLVTWQLAGEPKPDRYRFMLLHYLRLYHPGVYGFVESNQDHFESLRRVIIPETPGSMDSPEDAWLNDYFKHLHKLEAGDERTAKDLRQEHARHLSQRLDNYAGEKAFQKAFGKAFNEELKQEELDSLCARSGNGAGK